MQFITGVLALVGLLAIGGMIAKLADDRAEKRYPATGKFLTIAGVKLHYREEGTGPPVVLLHGNGGLIADMESSTLIARLSRSYRVLAFDRPGFGHSQRPAGRDLSPELQARLLIAASRELSHAPVVVVGHSLGALVAVAWGLEAPQAVRGLVLVSGYFTPTYRALELLKLTRLPLVGEILIRTLAPVIARLILPLIVRTAFAPLTPTTAFKTTMPWGLLLRSNQLATVFDELSGVPSAIARIGRRYRDLTVPVVLLAGTEDRVVNTHHHASALKRILPCCEIQLVPGVGHMLHHARPDLVYSAVDRVSHWRLACSALDRGTDRRVVDRAPGEWTLVDADKRHGCSKGGRKDK